MADKHSHVRELYVHETDEVEMAKPRALRSVSIRILAIFLGLTASVLLYGGISLLLVGGSPYYAASGTALLAVAILLWRRDGRASALYGIFLVLTLVWALAEAGFDGWALAPRLIGPAVVGLWFLIPRSLAEMLPEWRRRGALAVGTGILSVALAFMAALMSQGDPVLALPEARQTPMATMQRSDWQSYGGSEGGLRFSGADQITRDNVKDLKVAWTYRTGTLAKGTLAPFQATPLMVNDKLYLCGHDSTVIALDPASGREIWHHDPKADMTAARALNPLVACRGVAYRETKTAGVPCSKSIISPTADARLIALDAETGRRCPGFGSNGQIDLREGLGAVKPGYYFVSSPPAVVGRNIVVGGLILDNQSTDEPSGVIRAFNAETGELAWAWDLGRPLEAGLPPAGQTYTRATPNSWAPMSVDTTLGLIYVPTGNSTPDHWGAHRSPQSEAFASSLVALDINTGRPRWSFQFTHHDIWDYDVASQPVLADIPNGQGGMTPVVVQATKNGQIYVLDRRNGRPVKRVEERSVPGGAAAGDWVSPTQPFSVGMPHFGGDLLHERDMWGLTPLDQLWCRLKFRSLRYEGMYTPPSEKGTLLFPGVGGGMNWGSISVDPARSVMVTNVNLVPHIVTLIPRSKARGTTKGITGGGAGEFNDLNVAKGTPFQVRREGFTSPLMMPCVKPPFGQISAISLATGQRLWTRPLGTGRDAGPLGFASHLPLPIGTPNQGGSIITRNGIVFIGATQERAFRALDLATGRELWQTRLPVAAQATPMTYIAKSNGRQYVVIAAGGYPPFDPTRLSDYVIAYALPHARVSDVLHSVPPAAGQN